MDMNASRGRGRGRGVGRVPDTTEQYALRRPHAQLVQTGVPDSFRLPDTNEGVNYGTKEFQDMLRNAEMAVVTGAQSTSGGNFTNHIAVSQGQIAIPRELLRQDIPSPSRSSVPILNSHLSQHGVSAFNQGFPIPTAQPSHVVPSQLQNSSPINLHNSLSQNVPNVMQSGPSNIVGNVALPNNSINIIRSNVAPFVNNIPERMPLQENKNVFSQLPQEFSSLTLSKIPTNVQSNSINIIQSNVAPFVNNIPERLPLQENRNVFSHLPQEFSPLTLNSVAHDVIKKSKLSVDAPEFVPKSMPSIAPTTHQSQVGEQSLPPHAIPQLEYLNNPAIVQVNNFVVNLTLKPHKYNQIAKQLTALLSQVKDVNLMREIIAVIFEQGIGEPNFRYNGARLCQFLNKHITYSYNGPSFRDLLLKRCHDEYSFREFYLQQNCDRLCGFVLFLAEIFSNVVSSNSHYFDVLQTGVCGVLMILMSRPSSSNLKCVAKVLKGTGFALETCGAEAMDKVMIALKDVAMTAPVGVDVRALLLSIVELRASNWGRGHHDSTHPNTSSEVPLGTVYYGTNGDILKVVSDEVEESESDTDDWPTPEEDEEFFKCYEDFVQSQMLPSKNS